MKIKFYTFLSCLLLFLPGCLGINCSGEKSRDGTGPLEDRVPRITEYAGKGTRTDYFCLGGDCKTCTSNDNNIRISLFTDGSATVTTVVPCYSYGEKCIVVEGGNCAYDYGGSCKIKEGTLTVSICNNKVYTGSGKAMLMDKDTTGKVTYSDDKGPTSTLSWSAAPLVRN